MADLSFDDLIPKDAEARASGEGLSFDDLIPAKGELKFDDLIPKKPTAELRAAPEPTWREWIARKIAGDSGPFSTRERIADAVAGSTGIGRSGTIGMLDLFPPTGVALAGNDAVRAADEGKIGEAALSAIGIIPAPGIGPAARAVASAVVPIAAAEVASAAERLGVKATRAVDSGVAESLSSAPTLVGENPVRKAATRELEGLSSAVDRTLESASPRYSPADAARRATDDWLVGRTASDTAAEAELAALRTAEAPKPPAASPMASGEMEIVTPDSAMAIRARPEIVELSDLQLAGGRLQPRDRARLEYTAEARQRAARLDPEQLRPGRVSDSGAPIVMDDGTILSGNGRIMSIAEAYTDPALAERASAYRASLGPEAANMRQPVMVMRSSGMTPDDAARFADLSNRGRIAAMSAPERAARDAAALGADTLALYRGGDFASRENADFLRSFAGRVVQPSERAAFSLNGELTQEGIQRMRGAVLHSAYDDSKLLSRMLESTDDNIRNITGAMTDAAPGFANLKALEAEGELLKGLNTSPQLVEAVKLIADLRARGVSPAAHFNQIDAFAQVDPLVEAWVRAFYNPDLSRPISRQKMTEVMKAYTDEAAKHKPGGFLEDTTQAKDVVRHAREITVPDPAPRILQRLPEDMGAGVRDGGAGARGPAAAEVGSVAPEGGIRAEGNASGAIAGNVGAAAEGNAGRPVITAEQSARTVVENLTAARKTAISNALGIPVEAVTPEAVATRLMEMSRSRLPADVNGLMKVKTLVGEETWADISAGIMHRMGFGDGMWNIRTFEPAYKAMTENGRNTLFGGKGRESFKQALDDLTVMARDGRLDKLAKLADSEAGTFLEKLLSSTTARIGWLLLHPSSAMAASVPLLTGQMVASFVSRPIRAKALSRWSRAMTSLAEHQTPSNVAMAKLATQQLADAGENER